MNTYAEQLRDELVNAAVREHRTRRRRRAVLTGGAGVVAIAGVVLLLVGVLVAPDPQPVSANEAIRVTRDVDMTLIEIVGPERPDDVLADLRAAGLVANRIDLPTGPSRVGMVVSVVVEGGSTPTDNIDGMLSAYVDGRAHVQIGVGVETPPGGLYDIGTDAFAEGEPLRCRSWPGQPTAQLAAVADAGDISLRVIDQATGPVDALPAGGTVVSATAVAADRVIVTIGDGPAEARPASCASPPGAG